MTKKWLFVVMVGVLFLSACNSGTSNSSYVPPVNTLGGYSYGSVSNGGSEYTCTTFEKPEVYYKVYYTYKISFANVSPVAYIEATGTLPANWTESGNCTLSTISANPSCTFTFSESSTSPITTPVVSLQFNGSAGVAALGSIPAATCP